MAQLSFPCGPGWVDLAADGTVTGVRHDDQPGSGYVLAAAEVVVHRGGQPVTWSAPVVGADADEVEVVREGQGLRLVVRHSFVAGWGLRVALSNPGLTEEVLDDVLISWRVPEDRPGWAVAAGAVGSTAVFPADGTGPVLGGVLRRGEVARVDEQGLHLGRIVLAPGGRYVEQWHFDFAPTPADLDRGQDPAVPRRLDLVLGEAVTVPTTEDVALVVDPGLHVDTVQGGTELTAVNDGAFAVELRSARGSVAYQVRVAEPVEQVLAQVAAVALDQPRTGSGTIRLAGVEAALVVHFALGRGLVADDYAAEDALDLFAARLPDDDERDPLTVAFLCLDHVRSADPEPLDRASRAVLASREPAPGLGLAATQLSLARVLAGQSVAPVLEHLVALSRTAALEPAAGPRSAQAALLELEVVTMTRPDVVQPGAPESWAPGSALTRAAALGGWLGGGLRGWAVPRVPVADLAHLSAVLALLPEPVSAELSRRWGCSAYELARRGRTEVLTRLTSLVPGPEHAWLVLGSRPG